MEEKKRRKSIDSRELTESQETIAIDSPPILDQTISTSFTHTQSIVIRAEGKVPYTKFLPTLSEEDFLTVTTPLPTQQNLHAYTLILGICKQDIAIACLFVASKLEETVRKSRDLLVTVFRITRKHEFDPDDPEINEYRKLMLTMERDILLASSFRFDFDHPHRLMLKIVKSIGLGKEFAWSAWICLQDSYVWPICVSFNHQTIACAIVLLTCSLESVGIDRFNPLTFRIGGMHWTRFYRTDLIHVLAVARNVALLKSELDSANLKLKEILIHLNSCYGKAKDDAKEEEEARLALERRVDSVEGDQWDNQVKRFENMGSRKNSDHSSGGSGWKYNNNNNNYHRHHKHNYNRDNRNNYYRNDGYKRYRNDYNQNHKEGDFRQPYSASSSREQSRSRYGGDESRRSSDYTRPRKKERDFENRDYEDADKDRRHSTNRDYQQYRPDRDRDERPKDYYNDDYRRYEKEKYDNRDYDQSRQRTKDRGRSRSRQRSSSRHDRSNYYDSREDNDYYHRSNSRSYRGNDRRYHNDRSPSTNRYRERNDSRQYDRRGRSSRRENNDGRDYYRSRTRSRTRSHSPR